MTAFHGFTSKKKLVSVVNNVTVSKLTLILATKINEPLGQRYYVTCSDLTAVETMSMSPY